MNLHAHFAASFMSDAKWRKLFLVTSEHLNSASTAIWKLVDENKAIEGNLPSAECVWETAVDGCLNGPVAYSAIEWLEIPRTLYYRRYAFAPLSSRVQDVEKIVSQISKQGSFSIEETANGILFRGYLRVA